MKILVLNCGSSSVKYKLFDIDSKSVLAQGGAEKIGLEDSFLKLTLPNGEKVILKTSMPEHHSAIQNILNVLTGKEYGCGDKGAPAGQSYDHRSDILQVGE